MALIIGLAKKPRFLFLQLASGKLQRCPLRTNSRSPLQNDALFGRTAVRPYKKNMIQNMITHQEDRYAAPRIVPGAKAPASLPRMLLRASLPDGVGLTSYRSQPCVQCSIRHHFCSCDTLDPKPETRCCFSSSLSFSLPLSFSLFLSPLLSLSKDGSWCSSKFLFPFRIGTNLC